MNLDYDEDKFFSGILIENVFATSVYFKSVSVRKKNKESEACSTVTKYDTTDNKLSPVQAVATPGTHREAGLLTKPNQQPIDLRPPSNNGASMYIKITSAPLMQPMLMLYYGALSGQAGRLACGCGQAGREAGSTVGRQ
jgi:hypothetical protein